MTAGWLNYPVGGLDFETSGLDVESDRIVTAAVHFTGDGTVRRTISWLINPGVPIPAEAIAVHGVTDEMAAEGQDPVEALGKIESALHWLWKFGYPVIGHNVIFDLTILDRELRRHLGRPLEVTGPVIDTLVLDKAVDPYRKGSRRLADACAHWGVSVVEADLHTSSGDVVAAVELAQAIVSRGEYNGQPLIDLSLKDLHHWQIRWYGAQRESFNSWLRGQGRVPDDENTVWPVKPIP